MSSCSCTANRSPPSSRCRAVIHLNSLPEPPPAEPYLFLLRNILNITEIDSSISESDRPRNLEISKDAVPSPEDESEDAIAELMRQNSESEESDFIQLMQNGNLQPNAATVITGKWRKGDSSSVNIVLLVIACWILRVPIMYSDFIK